MMANLVLAAFIIKSAVSANSYNLETVETKDLAHKDNKIVIIVTHSRRIANQADQVLTLRHDKLS